MGRNRRPRRPSGVSTVESEGDTATSIKGSAKLAPLASREARSFATCPVPSTGKAFAVAACDRLYVQYGGVSGWLGLPISDAINTPDGQRQKIRGRRH